MGSSRGPSDTVQAAQQTSRSHAILLAAWALLAVLAVTGSRSAVASQVTSLPEGLLELATAPGYRVEIDSSGFDLPTAIAFIPQPGEEPDSPLYFVAELQGTIKVVTNDRTVHDFAKVPTWGRQGHDLEGASQQGLAGLCLEPDLGYLFATYTEPDSGGILRNRIVRFESQPVIYGLTPEGATSLGSILAQVQSAPAHQIGGCTIHEGELYLGVGDGGNARQVSNPSVLLGKIICMSLDGLPCRETHYRSPTANELEEVGRDADPASYAYATGFRNPFGIQWVNGELKVIENGIKLDRFLSVVPGRDHLWNGTDESIASLAEIILPRPFAPVQLAYVPPGTPYMEPGWAGHFVTAGYGSTNVPSGVALLGGEPDAANVSVPPSYLIEYVGPEGTQHFSGVAPGPDGIYAVPMLPVTGLTGVVLRLYYEPEHAHPVVVDKASGLFRGSEMPHLNELGCTSCHSIAGQGGDIGPNLDRFGVSWRITEFLNSDEYEAFLTSQVGSSSFGNGSGDALRKVLRAQGIDRTWTWLGYMLQDPDFDGMDRQMPNLGLSLSEAESARAELFDVLGLSTTPGMLGRTIGAVRQQWRAVLAGSIAGAVAVTALLIVFEFLWQRRKARLAVKVSASAGKPRPDQVKSTSA